MNGLWMALPLLAGAAFGQSLAEHTAAAAGGSAAGMAGKKVSDGIDKVFGKLGEQADRMGRTAARPRVKEVPATETKEVQSAPAAAAKPETKPLRTARARKPAARPAPLERAVEPAAPPEPAPPPPPPPPLDPSADDFARVAPGQSRTQLLTAVGTPLARISIPETGGLLEIYRYRTRDGGAASVRLNNGTVSEVRLPAPAAPK